MYSAEEIESAVRKIKKCLALSSSSNEHEAERAFIQAQKIMAQYGLSEKDVEFSEITKLSTKSLHSFNGWHNNLLFIISKFFTVYITFNRTSKKIFWHGTKSNTELAEYTYSVLLKKCKKERAEYKDKYLSSLSRSEQTKRANQYMMFFVFGIEKSIKNFIDLENENYENIKNYVQQNEKPSADTRNKNILNDFNIDDATRGKINGGKVKLLKPISKNDKETVYIE